MKQRERLNAEVLTAAIAWARADREADASMADIGKIEAAIVAAHDAGGGGGAQVSESLLADRDAASRRATLACERADPLLETLQAAAHALLDDVNPASAS